MLKSLFSFTCLLSLIALSLSSCGTVNRASSSIGRASTNVVSRTTGAITSAIGNVTGPNVPIVEVKAESLKSYETGEQKALAYQKDLRKRRARLNRASRWNSPQNIVIPDLSEDFDFDAINDGSVGVLPPKPLR